MTIYYYYYLQYPIVILLQSYCNPYSTSQKNKMEK